MKRHLVAESTSLQKRVLKYLEPDNLHGIEQKLQQLLRAERTLVKLSSRLDVSPRRLQTVIEDLLDVVNLIQL